MCAKSQDLLVENVVLLLWLGILHVGIFVVLAVLAVLVVLIVLVAVLAEEIVELFEGRHFGRGA